MSLFILISISFYFVFFFLFRPAIREIPDRLKARQALKIRIAQ